MKFALADHEQIINKGSANLKKQFEAVGGLLYLTSTGRLIHVPHKFNIQSGIVEISRANMVTIKTGWTTILGIPLTPNALIITLENGSTFKYVVTGKEKWKTALKALIAKMS